MQAVWKTWTAHGPTTRPVRAASVSAPARGRGVVARLGGEGEPDSLARSRRPFSQLVGNLLPVGGWRIYTISGSMPIFDRSAWRLEIGGLVRGPAALTYDDLRALPRADQVSTFHCVTGWTVDDVRWAGVRFEHLLELVEPLPEATAIRFVSLEQPYDDSLTLEQARLADVMLALELDGEPLSRPHGAPARVVIPEMYGYKGVKWLARMELVADAADRLLGRARLRPERLGRAVEWLWLSTSARCRASRARSVRCTGCTRPRS